MRTIQNTAKMKLSFAEMMNGNEQQKQTKFYTGYNLGFFNISSTGDCVFYFNLVFLDLLLLC